MMSCNVMRILLPDHMMSCDVMRISLPDHMMSCDVIVMLARVVYLGIGVSFHSYHAA